MPVIPPTAARSTSVWQGIRPAVWSRTTRERAAFGGRYSYTRWMGARDYPTLAIDRIGTPPRLGARCCLVLFGLIQIGSILQLVPLALGHAPVVPTTRAVFVLKVAYAASATVIGTVSMGLCRPKTAGADYSTLACVGSAIAFAAGAASLTVAGQVGYLPVLAAAATLACGGLIAAR